MLRIPPRPCTVGDQFGFASVAIPPGDGIWQDLDSNYTAGEAWKFSLKLVRRTESKERPTLLN
jgi:hypothetical protein